MKNPTKKQRNAIYFKAKYNLLHKENPKGRWKGICYSLLPNTHVKIGNFPEFELFKPKNKWFKNFWFSNYDITDKTQNHRLTALLLMYEMSK